MSIKKALRTISVEGCTAIASRANGKVYRLNEDSICKVFLGFSSKEMIEDEISHSRKAFVYGIPCDAESVAARKKEITDFEEITLPAERDFLLKTLEEWK